MRHCNIAGLNVLKDAPSDFLYLRNASKLFSVGGNTGGAPGRIDKIAVFYSMARSYTLSVELLVLSSPSCNMSLTRVSKLASSYIVNSNLVLKK